MSVETSQLRPGEQAKHFVFLIHGTWGKDKDGWYQASTSRKNFAHRLALKLEGSPLEGAIWRETEVFEWNGDNTHDARLKAAFQLWKRIAMIRYRYAGERLRFHFIAHSHGGNVVLRMLRVYLGQLPPIILNEMNFPKYITDGESASKFFSSASQIVKAKNLYPDNPLIRSDQKLYDAVRKWHADVEDAYQKYLSGRMHFVRFNTLILNLARILCRLVALPGEHEISSLVFLGTPFYYKLWKSNWRRRFVEPILSCLGQASVVGLSLYALILLCWTFLSTLSSTLIQTDPLHWHWSMQIGMGAAMFWAATVGYRRRSITANANIYFEDSDFASVPGNVHSLFGDLGSQHPVFDALVIKSGYIDEAFMGLSAFPLIERILPTLVDNLLRPAPWLLVSEEREVGRLTMPFGLRIIKLIRALLRWLKAASMFVGYPVRWLIYFIVTRPILIGQSKRIALPLSYGIPDYELLTGDIVVKEELEIPQIRTRTLDVSRSLLATNLNVEVDKKRFEFLWDDHVLEERFHQSKMARCLDQEPSTESKRHLLAIEERIKEFFGVAGLRHSLYYENDEVLEEVANFLTRHAALGSNDW